MIYWCIIDWLLRENIVIFLAEIAEIFLTVVPTITSHSYLLFYGTFKGKWNTWNLYGDHSPSKSEVQFLNLLWTIIWLTFKSYKNNRHQYPCSSFPCVFTKWRNNETSSVSIFPFLLCEQTFCNPQLICWTTSKSLRWNWRNTLFSLKLWCCHK